jgi:UDP-N-acetylglucosamine acyltransferase
MGLGMYFSHYSPSARFPGSWISESAKIEAGTIVLPGCVIGDKVKIGSDNLIGPNVVIEGDVSIGIGNILMPGVVIGMPSRHRIRFNESPKPPSLEPSILIGNNNILHEGVTVRLPMGNLTVIEDHVAIGAKTHIAHDCILRCDGLIAANCSFGGYVTIGFAANIGLGVIIHPRTAIGAYAMCGLGAGITRHVAPGATVGGVPAKYLKPNVRGMKRNGFTPKQIDLFCQVLKGKPLPDNDDRIGAAFQEFIIDVRRWGRSVDVLPDNISLQRS